MKKLALATALVLGVSAFALAQTTGTIMDQTQLKQHLEQQGYSDVTLQPVAPRALSGSSSGSTTGSTAAARPQVFSGTGIKDGKQVRFEIDSTGHITELQQ
jgi:hypothetical protein